MNQFDNLSGKTFGTWKVLEFDHMRYNGTNHRHGMSYYRCECIKCGAIQIKARSDLTHSPCKSHRGCGGR